MCYTYNVKMAAKAVKVTDGIFGQGFDVVGSAMLPKYGWEVGERIKLDLEVIILPSGKIHSQAYLERVSL